MVKRTVEIEVKTTGEQSVEKLDQSVKKLNTDISKTSKVSQGVGKALNKSTAGVANFGRASGQAGIQFQQFIGQVQGGQSAMLALSQQSADLGFVLGAPLLGAIVGISASLIGILVPALSDSGKKIGDFTFDVKEAAKELDNLSKAQVAVAVQETTKSLDGLSKQAGESGNKIASLNQKLDSGERLNVRITKTGRAVTETVKLTSKETEELVKQLSIEQSNLDKINKQYKDESDLLVTLTKNKGGFSKETQEQISKTEELSNNLAAQIIALDGGAEASLRYTIAKRLGLKEDEKLPDTIDAQITELLRLKQVKSDLEQQRKDEAKAAREESSVRRGFSGVESTTVSSEESLALKLAKDLEITFQYSQLGIDEEARALEIKRQLAEKYYADLAQLRANDGLGQVISSAQSVNSFIGSLQQINDKSKGLKKAAIVSNTAVAVMETYSRLGYPWGIPAATAVAAIGVKQLSQVGKQNYSSSSGGVTSDSAGFSTPTETEASIVPTVENTAITELTNELRNRDPDEPLTVDFTRRIIAAIDETQSSGQA